LQYTGVKGQLIPFELNNRIQSIYLLLLLPALLMHGCNSHPKTITKAGYYWQTRFDLSKAQMDSLQSLGITKLYVRFFDVTYDAEINKAVPTADIVFSSTPDSLLEIAPVVFIKNNVLQKTSKEQSAVLGAKICKRIKELSELYHLHNIRELQLDCDWTESTRDNFFELVKASKAISQQKIISCTIRLHQFKYFEKCGVPPCNRGMLMFYNMGKIDSSNKSISIYDSSRAALYLQNPGNYPLPLDVGVPLFDMAVLFRHGKPVNTISPLLTMSAPVKKQTDNIYIVLKDTIVNFTTLYKDDIIKYENVALEDCLKASRQVAPHLNASNFTVSIFDIDKQFFNNDTSGIQKIFTAFR
jgi:hypothetical protein